MKEMTETYSNVYDEYNHYISVIFWYIITYIFSMGYSG